MYYNYINTTDFLSLIATNIFSGCGSLTKFTFVSVSTNSVSLSNNIEQLGVNVFEGCKNLSNAIINVNTNIIPKNTFKGCSGLSNVYIPDNIEIIEESAFENCQNLDKIRFPPNLSFIGDNCFKDCIQLEEMIFTNESTDILTISDSAFDNCQQFGITNNSLIVANNTSIFTFFNTLFPYIKNLKLEYYNFFVKCFYDIITLFICQRSQTKQYLYPSLDVVLTSLKQIVNVNLINDDVVTIYNKLDIFRNIILTFIFDINDSYYNFITQNTNLKLTVSEVDSESYYVTVYKKNVQNINIYSDTLSTDYPVVYGLLSDTYTECQINTYKLRIDANSYNSFDIRYSSNDFTNTTELLNTPSNNSTTITNYGVTTGNYFDFIIYRKFLYTACNFYLENLELNISSKRSELLIGQNTNSFTCDATALLSIPLSLVTNTFLFRSDSINVDDNYYDGLKFKVDYFNNEDSWKNIIPTDAATSTELNGIPYYGGATNVAKNKIKYDFIRYISKKIFKTAEGADIFRNNDYVTTSLDCTSKKALRSRLSYLDASLGEIGYDTDYYPISNVTRDIFSQILYVQPERIRQLDSGDWTPMPLYVGDKLHMKLTINPEPGQGNILKKETPIEILPRSYLVKISLTE
jgi:hypothetical protein